MRPRALVCSKRVLNLALLVTGLVLVQSVAWAASVVKLNPATQPPSGLAGTSVEYLTGVNFPTGVIPAAGITINFATSCLSATLVTTTTATQVTTIPVPPMGAVRRVAFNIPATLATGTYAVWVVDLGLGITSSDCSALMVTNSTNKIAACIPSSSLAVSLGSTVTAYVPHGNWDSSTTGIGIVNIEGTPGTATIPTPKVVNACSSDSITGETVCTANTTDVYLITGTTLNHTLTSGANGLAGFSGGSCQNCGVAIDAANNTAYIEEGLTGGGFGEGVQPLNLATNTFGTPFPMHFAVSENITIDPFLNLLLSPGEDANYTILQIAPNGSISGEFGKAVSETELDSAAEDCTTGIALAASEFSSDVFIEDLTQATFTTGTPGSYTAPGKFVTLNGSFSAGTSGISVAPGSTHLAVVTGEFGGDTFAALQLPSTSGSGTPGLVDYAFTTIPGNPAGGSCGGPFNAGLDPHTLTAYTSPNNGKAYALFVGNSATCLVRIDLGAIIAAPRTLGTNTVATFPTSAITYFTIP